MNKVTILAPAKLNLFLKILNKRPDGFHNIETVFEKVSLFDKIIIKETAASGISLKSSSKGIPLGIKNLVYKAIELVRNRYKINKGLDVYLEKNIPVAAGLAGGSSDAVAALKGVNKLWRLSLSSKGLIELAKIIGSDTAFFAADDSFILAKGRGEQLFKIPNTASLKFWHILVVPDIKISTPYAYFLFDRYFSGLRLTYKCQKTAEKLRLTIPDYSANIITYALADRDVSLLNYYSYNSFDSIIMQEFARLRGFKKSLGNLISDFIHLSGSGAALFTTFSAEKEARYIFQKIKRQKVLNKCQCFLVHTY